MANSIDIVVGAQDKASQVLRNVAASAGNLSTSFTALGPALFGIGAAVAGAVGGFLAVKGAIEATFSAANRIDALTDKANGLGESVGSLQAFQFALAEAGNISGDKAISVLEKLTATVGQIAAGDNKAGLEAFKQLGLDAEQLSLQGPVAQFEAIQAKLAEITNTSERAAMAQKIFGRGAVELLPALNAQAESMKASAQYARDVGAAVSEEGAAGVAAMNDALGRVSLGFEGLFNTIAIELAPAIEQVALYIADWIPPLVDAARNIIPQIVDGIAAVADASIAAAEALGLIVRTEETWAEAIEQSRQAAGERAKELEAQRDAMRAATATPQAQEDTGAKAFESTLEALEKQLVALELGEEYVRSAEQLATARNEQERQRIELLQSQVFEQKKLNDLQDEAKRQAEVDAKKAADLAKMMRPDQSPQQAVQGRLLTRGTGGDVATQTLNAIKSLVKVAQQAARDEELYRRQKDRGFTVRQVVVP
jgi:hypothetical protein